MTEVTNREKRALEEASQVWNAMTEAQRHSLFRVMFGVCRTSLFYTEALDKSIATIFTRV